MAAPAKPAQSLLPGSSTSRVSYQHTWWQDATFNKPAAASLFNYTFRRQDDVVKVDFTVALNPPTLASQRGNGGLVTMLSASDCDIKKIDSYESSGYRSIPRTTGRA